MLTPEAATKAGDWTLGYSCLRLEIRAAQGQVIIIAAALSHSAHCLWQTSQHATAAKCRLRRTAGQMRFDDLAASAEKLPGRILLTLI